MIEAVENHMPEVIVIDEIGTELEALAARTIAERGVQLGGTAHGNTLENLIMNPTLSDLIGGIQSVTLGDEEAKRRGTRKSILERTSPPTFDIVVEIQDRDHVAIHPDVAQAVDDTLRNVPITQEGRGLDENGEVVSQKIEPAAPVKSAVEEIRPASGKTGRTHRLFLFGVNRGKFEQIARDPRSGIEITENIGNATLFVTSKRYYRRKPQKIKDAETANLPIYVLKSNTPVQIRQFIQTIAPESRLPDITERSDSFQVALKEAQEAVHHSLEAGGTIELSPQSAYIRRLQHLVAERNQLHSRSSGKDPHRHVRIYRG
jgi:hypothetical protein